MLGFSFLLLSTLWIFGVLFVKAEMLAEDVQVFLKLIMLNLQEKCRFLLHMTCSFSSISQV